MSIWNTKKKTYNSLSRWYDAISGKRERSLGFEAAQWLMEFSQGDILEIGCGTGNASAYLHQKTEGSQQIISIDLAYQMCIRTRKRIISSNCSNPFIISNANAIHLPFQENSINGILMAFTFELFPAGSISSLLDECKRVLEKNGYLCLVGMSIMETPNLIYYLYKCFNKTFPKWVDCRPVNFTKYLVQSQYTIIKIERKKLWGLPVEIVLAQE